MVFSAFNVTPHNPSKNTLSPFTNFCVCGILNITLWKFIHVVMRPWLNG